MIFLRRSGTGPPLLLLCISCFLACADSPSVDDGAYTALEGGTVYVFADEAPLRDGVVLIEGMRIREVGEAGSVRLPGGTTVIDVHGFTVLPGFWNSHAHLTETKWEGGDTLPPARLTELMREMFTRYGFVHVYDIASFGEQTLALRSRLQQADVAAPDVLTTMEPFVPPDGTPRYVESLELPELHDPAAARDSVRARVARGSDGIKLFTVPLTRRRPFPVMPLEVVEAVTDEAHREGLMVFAHPSNREGVEVATTGGVDVLAHSAPMGGELPASLLDEMSRRSVALIPTLTLWEDDYGADTTGMRAFVRAGQEQVRAYATRGGRILFGTDVGYLTRYDPTREYELMAEAGLSFVEILRSLTSAPSEQFGHAERTGRIAPGFDANLVVIAGDPLQDIRALAHIHLTMKRGRVLFHAAESNSQR